MVEWSWEINLLSMAVTLIHGEATLSTVGQYNFFYLKQVKEWPQCDLQLHQLVISLQFFIAADFWIMVSNYMHQLLKNIFSFRNSS